MNKFGLLLWQKWKRFRYEGRYWLRAFGYDTDDRSFNNRAYGVYLVIFGVFWGLAMWSLIGEQFVQVGIRLDEQDRERIINLIPVLVVALQAAQIYSAGQTSPLKLTTQDGAYVAASPMPRVAITAIRFLQTIYGRWVLLTPLTTLVLMGLSWHIGATVGGIAGVQVLLLMPLVIACVWGAAWVVGLLRLWRGDADRIQAYGVGLALLPVTLLPGFMLRSIASGELSLILTLGTALAAATLIAAVLYCGRYANMVRVVAESRVFGRISDLGPMAQIYALETIEEIRKEGKRDYHLPLPTVWGTAALFGRAATFYIRGRRLDLLLVTAWGAAAALLVVLTGRIENVTPLQTWAGIILLAVLIPPRPVVRVFAEDQQRPFVRQFIPTNDLLLLLIDSAVPLTLLVLAASGVWLWQVGSVAEIGLIALMALLLTLCMSFDHIRPYRLEGRISYVQGAAVSFAVSIGLGLLFNTFWITVIALSIFIALTSLYIAD